jgi:EAL domain-containing protein (putative c-di-GMP-specific phosphodiesterase class I)
MKTPQTPRSRQVKVASADCFAEAGGVGFSFSFAFQPIVDAATREIVSFEALVRGPRGEPSAEVFACVPRDRLYRFDQACRLKAIHLARRLRLETGLNLNLFPNSIHRTGMNIQATLQAALDEGLPAEKLIFEVNEADILRRDICIEGIFEDYRHIGFQTALDDFGAGYSGLRLLAEYQPDYIKLDRNLIADIHQNRVKQAIVRGIHGICLQLAIEAIAEGVEKAEEYQWLQWAGIRLFQGFYFARPTFEALADVQPGVF